MRVRLVLGFICLAVAASTALIHWTQVAAACSVPPGCVQVDGSTTMVLAG